MNVMDTKVVKVDYKKIWREDPLHRRRANALQRFNAHLAKFPAVKKQPTAETACVLLSLLAVPKLDHEGYTSTEMMKWTGYSRNRVESGLARLHKIGALYKTEHGFFPRH